MGPHSLHTSHLVFGAFSTCPAALKHKSRQVNQLKALKTARRNIQSYVAKQPILTALKSEISPHTRLLLQSGQEVTVFRERHRRWLGAY